MPFRTEDDTTRIVLKSVTRYPRDYLDYIQRDQYHCDVYWHILNASWIHDIKF